MQFIWHVLHGFWSMEMWFYPFSHFSLEVHNGITNHKYYLMFVNIFYFGFSLGVFYKIKITCMTMNDLFPFIPCKQVDVIVMCILVAWVNTMKNFNNMLKIHKEKLCVTKPYAWNWQFLCEFKIVENCMAKVHHKQSIKFCWFIFAIT